jgi:hypothetical protein
VLLLQFGKEGFDRVERSVLLFIQLREVVILQVLRADGLQNMGQLESRL